MYQNIKCPNCKREIKAILQKNRWVKWIKVECYNCGYRKLVEEKEFDYIQPSSPFFKIIYGHDPLTEENTKIKINKLKKENQNQEREDNLEKMIHRGKLKPHEFKDIKSYVKNRGLE